MTNIERRAIEEAKYILGSKQTIRQCAKAFGVSKSTVHYDISCRLKGLNARLYSRLKVVLDTNFADKHIRGGMATKNKYKSLKNQQKYCWFFLFKNMRFWVLFCALLLTQYAI